MDVLAYLIFGIAVLGPLVGYAIYTALRGEPRRPDKPAKGKSAATTPGGATP
ncbi:hypothetical protein [Pseudolysinimonas sp.]|jgi:hypothetical protein|uniref:hypothetical protein n=1 Tax=Pseudolysinimonas sp. TaxID=2680009 RepID=UPI003784F26F